MLLRPAVLALAMVLLGDAALPAEVGDSPAGARVTAAAAPQHAGRKTRKKRRRLRRKAVKPTKFQNLTPHEHLGPGISR